MRRELPQWDAGAKCHAFILAYLCPLFMDHKRFFAHWNRTNAASPSPLQSTRCRRFPSARYCSGTRRLIEKMCQSCANGGDETKAEGLHFQFRKFRYIAINSTLLICLCSSATKISSCGNNWNECCLSNIDLNATVHQRIVLPALQIKWS